MHVGAIDIGTNSTHLVIASIDTNLQTFSIELAEKSSTRLGERDLDSGELTEISMQRTLDTLKRFKELALSYKVHKLMISATSAVRESANGKQFIQQVRDQLNLEIELISGSEEARLIYLGVLSGMPFGEKPHFLIDIGGGSTELVLADGNDARALTSTRVGAVRLKRDFVKVDPMSSSRIDFLKTFVKGSLEPAIDKINRRIRPGESPIMVATSGTALSIGNLIQGRQNFPKGKLHGCSISKKSLDELLEKLFRMSPNERSKLPEISTRRSEIIVTGGIILQASMEMLDVNEIVLSERALREGMIVNWMFRQGLCKNKFTFQSSIRKSTVIHQAKRFRVDRKRSEKVANLALMLFDDLKNILHSNEDNSRDLLWASAMLYSSGQHINLSSYHKHSWYLIRHGELLGYSQSEHLMIAAIARYHRKSVPKKRHEAWQCLENKKQRQIVEDMSLILRLATSIDIRPDSMVNRIEVKSNDSEIILKLIPQNLNQDMSLEIWSLNNCATILKQIKGINLKVIS